MKNTLTDKKYIDTLFSSGKYVTTPLVAAKFLPSGENKFLFAVSSKKFKRAVDRNRIKRLMRESVKDLPNKNKNIALIFNGQSVATFSEIDKSIKKIWESL
jgi:ribonuclease P protein component